MSSKPLRGGQITDFVDKSVHEIGHRSIVALVPDCAELYGSPGLEFTPCQGERVKVVVCCGGCHQLPLVVVASPHAFLDSVGIEPLLFEALPKRVDLLCEF